MAYRRAPRDQRRGVAAFPDAYSGAGEAVELEGPRLAGVGTRRQALTATLLDLCMSDSKNDRRAAGMPPQARTKHTSAFSITTGAPRSRCLRERERERKRARERAENWSFSLLLAYVNLDKI